MSGTVSGDFLIELLRKLAKDHDLPEAYNLLCQETTSCAIRAEALQQLFVGEVEQIYKQCHLSEVKPEDFNKIKSRLIEGGALFVHLYLPDGDHAFAIIGDAGEAYVLHSWQNKKDSKKSHDVRSEKKMLIEKMYSLLKDLPIYDYTKPDHVRKVCNVRKLLWGCDHMGPVQIKTEGRTKHSYTYIASGKPKESLEEFKETLRRVLSECAAKSNNLRLLAEAAQRVDKESALEAVEEIEEYDADEGSGRGKADKDSAEEGSRRYSFRRIPPPQLDYPRGGAAAALDAVEEMPHSHVDDDDDNVDLVEEGSVRANEDSDDVGDEGGGNASDSDDVVDEGRYSFRQTLHGGAVPTAVWNDTPHFEHAAEWNDSVSDFFGEVQVHNINIAETIAKVYFKKLADKPSGEVIVFGRYTCYGKDWCDLCNDNLVILLQSMFPNIKSLLNSGADM